MSNTRISLSADDFATLISGGTVKDGTTEIRLQDIGYSQMLESIYKSMRAWPPTNEEALRFNGGMPEHEEEVRVGKILFDRRRQDFIFLMGESTFHINVQFFAEGKYEQAVKAIGQGVIVAISHIIK